MWTAGRMLALAVALVASAGVLHAADNDGPQRRKNNQRRETPQEKARELAQKQREQAEQLRRAAVELAKQERAALAAANEELATAQAAHRAASKNLADAKTKASAELEKSLGLERALADMQAAQQAHDSLADPILKTVRATPEFRKASDKATAAETAIRAAQADKSLTEAERRTRVNELLPDTLVANEIEKQALKNDAGVTAARGRLEAAQRRVSDLRSKLETKLEKHEAVGTARTAVGGTSSSVDQAESRLARVKAQAAAAEARLQAGIIPRAAQPEKAGSKDGDKGKKD